MNQVEKRCLAYGGSTRSDAMPVTFSSTFRVRDPGVPVARLATGATAEATLPRRSVRPRTWSVSFFADAFGWPTWRTASARSMSRGKSSAHSCLPGVYGQLSSPHSLQLKHSSTTASCSPAVRVSERCSGSRSTRSNSRGKVPQNLKHNRHPWHRSKTRSISWRRSVASQYAGSNGS